MLADVAHHGSRDDFVRVAVLRQLPAEFLAIIIRCCLDCIVQFRYRSDLCLVQICHETGVNNCPVLVSHRDSLRHIADRASAAGAEQCQRWSKQKKRDVLLAVELHDLRQDGERRVVYHHVLRSVLFRLVVTARIERTDEVLAVELVFFRHPLSDGVVYALRCVAVVCCFLRLELVQEVVVLVVPFFSAVV